LAKELKGNLLLHQIKKENKKRGRRESNKTFRVNCSDMATVGSHGRRSCKFEKRDERYNKENNLIAGVKIKFICFNFKKPQNV
jgi:hypothetical protein